MRGVVPAREGGTDAARAVPNNILGPLPCLGAALVIILFECCPPDAFRSCSILRREHGAQRRWETVHGGGCPIAKSSHGRRWQNRVAHLLEEVYHVDDAPVNVDAVAAQQIEIKIPDADPGLLRRWWHTGERRHPTRQAIGGGRRCRIRRRADEVQPLAVWYRGVEVEVLSFVPPPEPMRGPEAPNADVVKVVNAVLRPIGAHLLRPSGPVVPSDVEVHVRVHADDDAFRERRTWAAEGVPERSRCRRECGRPTALFLLR
mmetsp:Transcript_118463/g.334986  ORF Transcript_118463/g.334986 Transcript_118463/m.334986 type:complete len:260 (-) Transcript_118463:228-1007(-)